MIMMRKSICQIWVNIIISSVQVSSPFKKRPREDENDSKAKRRRSSAETQAATSTLFKTERDATDPNPLADRLKEIAAKTRDKLQGFAAADIESTSEGRRNSIDKFDFSILKREKATVIPDIDLHEPDEVITNSHTEGEPDVGIMETEDAVSTSSSANMLSVFKNKRRSSAVSLAAQKGTFDFL